MPKETARKNTQKISVQNAFNTKKRTKFIVTNQATRYIRYYKIQSSENNQLQNAFVFQMKQTPSFTPTTTKPSLKDAPIRMKQVQSYIS